MHLPFFSKLLCVLFACALLSPLPPAQANESLTYQTVTLEKHAYFLTPKGESVQLQPGSYQLDPLADRLQVTRIDRKTASLELAITIDTHDQNLLKPMAVSVSGLPETDSSDRHVLAVFLPGGLVYEATGTYSGIRSRDVDPQSLIADPMKVYLEKPVHFLSLEGNGLEVQPGTYTVERAKGGIRLLTPEKEEELLLEAHPDIYKSELDTSVALSLPGDAEEEADLHYIVLMAPNGESLQALGTYSGIHQRGLFQNIAKSKTVNRARGAVRRVGQNAQKVRKDFQQSKVGQFTANVTLEAKKKAEWLAKQAAQGALILAKATCKGGLTLAQMVAEGHAKLLGPLKEKLAELLKVDKAQQAMRQAIDRIKERNAESIGHSIEAAQILTDPKNFNSVKDLISPNKMCDRPGNTIQNTFQKMVGGPVRQALAVSQTGNDSQVRSRGSFASASIALGGNLAKVGGVEGGVRFAFDFVNKSHLFIDIAGLLKTNVGGGGGVAVGIFPRKDPVDTGGWFLGAGIGFPCKVFKPSLPKEVACNVDFFFDTPLQFDGSIFKPQWDLTSWQFFLDHFQGFAVGIGGGKSISPVEIAVKVGGGIRVTKQ